MIKKFFTCGVIGWCLEILFTSAGSIKNHDVRLRGNTSLWMFPIYGMAILIEPLSHLLKGRSFMIRGSIYTCLIFIAEFCTGTLLKLKKACPWDYSKAKLNIGGVIRLDYAPCWFFTGLLYETVLAARVPK